MNTIVKIPETRAELIEIGKGLVKFPATWEEYWEWLPKVEYNIEYQNREIIATGYESNAHGNIIFELSFILRTIFSGKSFQGFAENRPVFLPFLQRVYNPDVMLIDGPSELFEYSTGLNAETNPFLVVEVLSKSTYDHDWENKLPGYQSLPSVEYILLVESRFPAVTVFTRTNNGWDKAFFNEKVEEFVIRGKKILVGDVYRKTGYFGK